jgi:hypothetical protein
MLLDSLAGQRASRQPQRTHTRYAASRAQAAYPLGAGGHRRDAARGGRGVGQGTGGEAGGERCSATHGGHRGKVRGQAGQDARVGWVIEPLPHWRASRETG